VAERSLFLWNHEYIITLVAQYRQAVLPIVFGALEENANNHWNPAVHGLTCNVRKMFMVSAGSGLCARVQRGLLLHGRDGCDSRLLAVHGFTWNVRMMFLVSVGMIKTFERTGSGQLHQNQHTQYGGS
jgi:hypothetical protein